MKKQKLRFGATFREGLVYAGRNFFPLLGCILLYFLTIWIPYLNIGTMIAMTLLPVQMSKGESINPSHIFNPRYRKYMSEYFILVGIMYAALIASLLFCHTRYSHGHGMGIIAIFPNRKAKKSHRGTSGLVSGNRWK